MYAHGMSETATRPVLAVGSIFAFDAGEPGISGHRLAGKQSLQVKAVLVNGDVLIELGRHTRIGDTFDGAPLCQFRSNGNRETVALSTAMAMIANGFWTTAR
jgi:hypothetical protein